MEDKEDAKRPPHLRVFDVPRPVAMRFFAFARARTGNKGNAALELLLDLAERTLEFDSLHARLEAAEQAIAELKAGKPPEKEETDAGEEPVEVRVFGSSKKLVATG